MGGIDAEGSCARLGRAIFDKACFFVLLVKTPVLAIGKRRQSRVLLRLDSYVNNCRPP